MRFGIGEKSDHTLEEVGQKFTVTRERIRQIEAKGAAQTAPPEPQQAAEEFHGNLIFTPSESTIKKPLN